MRNIKNPKTLMVLVIVAISVWGMIVYRLTVCTDLGDAIMPIVGTEKRMVVKRRDPLLLNYRDPFSDIRKSGAIVTPFVGKSPFHTSEQKELPPAFRMRGKIRKGMKDFLLISKKEENQLVGLNDKVDGFTILKIYDDSVIVIRGNKKIRLVLE